MSFSKNIFCWQGISTDMALGAAFYPRVLDWQHISGGEDGPIFVAPGGAVAHIQPPQGPPAWCAYFSVDDVDAAHEKALAHGSHALVPPTDLPAGRFSILTTPSGAVLGLYRPAESDELAQPGVGSVHSVELKSTAPEADLEWFELVFGVGHSTVDGWGWRLHADGLTQAVVTATQGQSGFVSWVQVRDADTARHRAVEAGGQAIGEVMAWGGGRGGLVGDPSGAVFGVWSTAAAPSR